MLKKQNIKISERKKSKLQNSPGEIVRDSIIKAGVKAAEEADYAAGNQTEVLVELAQKAEGVVDGGTALLGGGEAVNAFGLIAYKTTKDIARGDAVCTGFCLVSGTCEAVALGCSTIKVIPFRGRIYVGAKIISKGCISFRNACAGAGC